MVVAKKGVADLDNRALSEGWKNYGAATVAWLAGPDSPHRVYQRLISPLLGPHCRFTPTVQATELRHCAGLE